MSGVLKVGRGEVGPDRPVYFVADIAANHDGDLDRARSLIRLAAEAGANAAKFQNFRAGTIVSDFGFKALGGQQSHQSVWKKSVFEVYQDASLPLEWTTDLAGACAEVGIDYFTAPYDLDLVDVLEPHVCAWKLGSGDITWHDMIERLARGGKPLFLATGASGMDEVDLAVNVALRHARTVVLMQCNTNYTGSPDNFRHVALNVLKAYARRFPQVVLGLSDHTPGHATALGAVALGARVIEKHFTDDTLREGPDHKFSMDPASWRDMVDRVRELEAALGGEEKRVMDNENETAILQRRAVRAVRDIRSGEALALDMLTVLRPCPAGALPPYRADELLGRRSARDIPAGDVVTLSDVL
jgi:N-acetylneuraminate synthase